MRCLYTSVAFLALLPAAAPASTVPFFGTGLDAAGNYLPVGALDPHWTITTYADPSVAVPIPLYLDGLFTNPSGPYGSDVGPGPLTGGYIEASYTTTFDLTGFDPATGELRLEANTTNTSGGPDVVFMV